MMDVTTGSPNLEYFAATEDPDELAAGMTRKIYEWRQYCNGRGLTGLWNKKLTNYYGISVGGNSSHSVTPGGTEGELNFIKINDLRTLIQEQLVVVTSQRPAGQAKAVNSNTQSLKAARIGTAVAEYYMDQEGYEGQFVSVAEMALVCDEGFTDLFWDKTMGDPIMMDPETGDLEMSGDCLLRVHGPWNVTRDPGLPVKKQKWHILDYAVNKFDLASAYPKFREHIISIQDEDDLPEIPMNEIPEGSDAIFVHLLCHDRTPSVPRGRYSLMAGGKIVLDGQLPFKYYPVDRIASADVIDGPTGYCAANDILAAEEVTDALHSIITTNEINFGGNTIIAPIGCNIQHTNLAKGSRMFEVPPELVDKIKTLELVKTAPEIFNYIQLLGGKKERAVGSVQSALAQQASQAASGSSMALIQAQAISFNSGTQRGYYRILSSVMTKLLSVLETHADSPRIARIVGKTNFGALKEFMYNGTDLSSVSAVVYELINPMAQTFGGRLTWAQDLLKQGLITSPKQYITVATTGQVDPLIQDDEAKQMLILEENEWLVEGKEFHAVITQNHSDHIKSHEAQITLEMQANDPDAVARNLTHQQEHIDLWMKATLTNPGILIATGQQPLFPPQGQLPPPQGGGQANGDIGGLVGHGAPPASQEANEVRQPSLPTIAGTAGEKPPIPGVTDLH